MEKLNLHTFVSLHMLLALYSLTDLFGKAAAGYALDDVRFYAFYGLVLIVLFVYALGWQQIIKRLPLTTAFSNKAITVFWGLVWGVLFFQEQLTPLKVIGAGVVVLGVVLFSRADGGGDAELVGDVGLEHEGAAAGVSRGNLAAGAGGGDAEVGACQGVATHGCD